MDEKGEATKTTIFVFVVLTVIVSILCTWSLVDSVDKLGTGELEPLQETLVGKVVMNTEPSLESANATSTVGVLIR